MPFVAGISSYPGRKDQTAVDVSQRSLKIVSKNVGAFLVLL
jgi:hypothetical protein